MDQLSVIYISLALAGLSLLTVSIVNQRQTRRRIINSRVHQLKRRINDLEALSAELEPLLESNHIPALINDEVVSLIHTTQNLAPDNHYLEANLSNAEERDEVLRNPTSKQNLYRMQQSDAAVARAQFWLNEAARIVRVRQARGELEVAEMEAYIDELTWSHLMVEVTTFIGQGHKAVNSGDVLRAYAFYRKAQQLALGTSHGDERRHRIIKELGDIMSNKRRSLSLELMPEADLNPTDDAAKLITPDEALEEDQRNAS